ncbi:UDP-N-acetylmuramate dehydrogenase [candidate division TA06 bacterium]|uniref:UDP-N-acetylenolpyruvoylglucosamine reductase n=1 Tax=candidate division TA06 bacterium TaxID=2250710 RepID=A0A933IDQ2_UNCT6|nr:UDP-N-acetylmuramate dehydrogenase [candidate division TA06 bacterium]
MVKESKILDLPQGLAGEYLFNEPLKGHTSFRIGGPAELVAVPGNEEALSQLLARIRRNKLDYYVLGNGSNLLAGDKGYKGVVIKIAKDFRKLSREGNRLKVESGYPLPALVDYCAKAGLAGLEWAVGVPGSLGGALVMNAGAYGGQMADVVKKVWGLTAEGKKKVLSPKQIKFSYRQAHYPKGFVITGAGLELKPGSRRKIEKAMSLYLSKRKRNQPLSLPSAGCIFKNPEGDSAKRLIAVAGMKGKKLGGAAVSVKHANFIVNQGGATAAEVLALIKKIQSQTHQRLGIRLVPEVKILGK